jgi:hypothetical protein
MNDWLAAEEDMAIADVVKRRSRRSWSAFFASPRVLVDTG